MGISSSNPRRGPLDGGLLPVTSDDLQPRTQAEGAPSCTKAAVSVQTVPILTMERSQQTSSIACGSGSGPASYPGQQGPSAAQRQSNDNARVDGSSGTGGYSTGSSGSGSANGYPLEILSLLRGWRQSFINVDNQTLAEAGILVTSPRTSSQQPVGIEQVRPTLCLTVDTGSTDTHDDN